MLEGFGQQGWPADFHLRATDAATLRLIISGSSWELHIGRNLRIWQVISLFAAGLVVLGSIEAPRGDVMAAFDLLQTLAAPHVSTFISG